MIFILHYEYSIAVVAPFNQNFVDAIKTTFSNGVSDYRRDSRFWLFDEEHETKVRKLLAEHFPNATVMHFIERLSVAAVDAALVGDRIEATGQPLERVT